MIGKALATPPQEGEWAMYAVLVSSEPPVWAVFRSAQDADNKLVQVRNATGMEPVMAYVAMRIVSVYGKVEDRDGNNGTTN